MKAVMQNCIFDFIDKDRCIVFDKLRNTKVAYGIRNEWQRSWTIRALANIESPLFFNNATFDTAYEEALADEEREVNRIMMVEP